MSLYRCWIANFGWMVVGSTGVVAFVSLRQLLRIHPNSGMLWHFLQRSGGKVFEVVSWTRTVFKIHVIYSKL